MTSFQMNLELFNIQRGIFLLLSSKIKLCSGFKMRKVRKEIKLQLSLWQWKQIKGKVSFANFSVKVSATSQLTYKENLIFPKTAKTENSRTPD